MRQAKSRLVVEEFLNLVSTSGANLSDLVNINLSSLIKQHEQVQSQAHSITNSLSSLFALPIVDTSIFENGLLKDIDCFDGLESNPATEIPNISNLLLKCEIKPQQQQPPQPIQTQTQPKPDLSLAQAQAYQSMPMIRSPVKMPPNINQNMAYASPGMNKPGTNGMPYNQYSSPMMTSPLPSSTPLMSPVTPTQQQQLAMPSPIKQQQQPQQQQIQQNVGMNRAQMPPQSPQQGFVYQQQQAPNAQVPVSPSAQNPQQANYNQSFIQQQTPSHMQSQQLLIAPSSSSSVTAAGLSNYKKDLVFIHFFNLNFKRDDLFFSIFFNLVYRYKFKCLYLI